MLLFFGLLIVAVLRSPNLMTSSGIGSAEIVVAPLILSTYALMATALAGPGDGRSLDRAADRLHQRHADPARRGQIVTSPIAVFAYALAAGVALSRSCSA